ncbi:MAG: inosine monophosphate cyclohydrolase, partial [Clostridia bacterium]|nr:inosine monophosphate cyclohydrolase [Clostridia bacterium]
MKTYENRLADSSYPGRGIVIGGTPDGGCIAQVYWIMGRSDNSRNRIFEKTDGFIRTKAFDEALMKDPSLIIYFPMKHIGGDHIVSNGDQTDTIYEYISKGGSFEEALGTREFEPDSPNYTPRISGIANPSEKGFRLSILKTIGNDPGHGVRIFYNYASVPDGYGYCITTYNDDGSPLPSFGTEPYAVGLLNDIDAVAENFWNLLDKENRVSLAVKFIDRKTGGA